MTIHYQRPSYFEGNVVQLLIHQIKPDASAHVILYIFVYITPRAASKQEYKSEYDVEYP